VSEQHEWFESILANTPSATYRLRCDDALSVEYVSAWIEAIAGWPISAFKERPNLYPSIVHPEDRGLLAEVHRKAMASDEPQAGSYRLVRPDGEVCWVIDRCRAVRDAAGNRLWLDGVVVDQTEQKHIEAELEQERDLLQMFLDNTPDAVYFKDAESRFVRVSRVYHEMHGLDDPRHIVGKTDFDFFDEASAAQMRAEELAVMQSQEPIIELERGECWNDGTRRWSLISKLPWRDVRGDVIGIFGMSRDMTQRKLAELELRLNNERLERIVATQRSVAAAGFDLEAVMTLIVEEAQALTGADGGMVSLLEGDNLIVRAAAGIAAPVFGKEISRGRSVTSFAIAERRAILIEDTDSDPRIDQAMRSTIGDKSLICVPLFHHDEVVGVLHVMSVSEQDRLNQSHLRTLELLGFMFSAALSQAAEFEAKEARVDMLARFEAIYQHAPVGIAILGLDGYALQSNPAMQTMFGYSAAELGTRSIVDHTHPDDVEQVALFRDLAAGVRDFYRIQKRYLRKDGDTVWADVSVTLVRDGDGNPAFAVGMIENVTDQRRAEEDRDRMELELRLAQKLEAVGQLAAGIAHEVNTPIQFVGDSVEFLRGGFEDLLRLVEEYQRAVEALGDALPPATREQLERAAQDADVEYLGERGPTAFARTLDGVARVATIVRAMKEFAHPSSGEMSPLDVNTALENTLIVAANELKYVADVVLELGELPPVLCYASDVNQVFLNLVVNAAHAMADVIGEAERGTLTVRSRQEGDLAVVEIEDTGGGIPEDVQGRIFDPFFTTKEVGRGTGQGLAIARTIVVERHEGSLAFRTEPGRGTTFVVQLPIAGQAEVSPSHRFAA
jgi:PAS domain S-box-containing protein